MKNNFISFSAFYTDRLGDEILKRARKLDGEKYTMELVGDDAECVRMAVNQGIDSYLEACFVPDRGDSYNYKNGRLYCTVSSDSLKVLVRRLMEMDDSDNAVSLASGICGTLGIELV